MAVATLGAMAIAIYENGDYTEAIAVMLFYQIGELFQSYAVGKSRRNISDLMDIRPDYANISAAQCGLEKEDLLEAQKTIKAGRAAYAREHPEAMQKPKRELKEPKEPQIEIPIVLG